MPEMHEFEACFNFRDLGGHVTGDGRVVRRGHVFRSGSLHRMTAADRRSFARLGITTVVDLRRPDEVGRHPPPPGIAPRIAHLPLETEIPATEGVAADRRSEHLGEEYLEIAGAPAGHAAITAAIDLIAQPRHRVVVHCYAGKDRTGILAALLLSALGVDDDAIAADYAASDAAIAPSIAYAERHEPDWARLIAGLPDRVLRAHPRGILTLLGGIRARHDSVRSYLHAIGTREYTLARLEAKLLE